MEKNTPFADQELILGSSDPKISREIKRLVDKGRLRKIAPRIYTADLITSPEVLVRRHLFALLGKLYPDSLLSHRSALEFQPTSTGQIFLSYGYTKRIKLPGVTVRLLQGPGPVEGDHTIAPGLRVSQRERAILENLSISRQSGPESKNVARSYLEQRLDQIVRIHGEEELYQIRDRARQIADSLGMTREYRLLDKIIGAILSTHSSKVLSSSVAIARAAGHPYDPDRLNLFEILFRELKQSDFERRPEKNTSNESFEAFAFYESYFSNYIEGTIFELDEAKTIIETQQALPNRNLDSHDILGTYRLVSNRVEMNRIPRSPSELTEIIQSRHAILLGARREVNPGMFKDVINRAGQTVFVLPELVRGTLMKGYDLYAALEDPLSRAMFMMFLISEVHPFLDGNGRLARIMMNAELFSAQQSKIIIPTVYRDDYLLTLRRLTRKNEPIPYIKMLARAHHFSSTIHGASSDIIQDKLERSHAFGDSHDARLRILEE